jgi:TRAP-type transport system periplasmic protein
MDTKKGVIDRFKELSKKIPGIIILGGKMKRKTLLSVVIGICLVLSLAATTLISACAQQKAPAPATSQPAAASPTATGPVKIIKFAIGLPPSHTMVVPMYAWAMRFNEAAKGRYQINVAPGGVLTTTTEQLNAVRTGAVEMAQAATSFYAGDIAAFGCFDVPFLFTNFAAQQAAVPDIIQTVLSSITEKQVNQKCFAPVIFGIKDPYSTKKPIKTLEDWKGLLVSVQSPIEAEIVKALGGAPVTTEWLEEIQNLQKGVIDAGIITDTVGLYDNAGYSDVIKNVTSCGMKGGPAFVGINLDVYNGLPADLKKVMDDEARRYSEQLNSFYINYQDYTKQKVVAKGVNWYNLPSAERTRWVAATKPVADKFWAQLPADVSKAIQAICTKANAANP